MKEAKSLPSLSTLARKQLDTASSLRQYAITPWRWTQLESALTDPRHAVSLNQVVPAISLRTGSALSAANSEGAVGPASLRPERNYVEDSRQLLDSDECVGWAVVFCKVAIPAAVNVNIRQAFSTVLMKKGLLEELPRHEAHPSAHDSNVGAVGTDISPENREGGAFNRGVKLREKIRLDAVGELESD
jgi:hypothetical protein